MSSPGSPRQVRRRRGQRMAAVSLVATASLLGTYLGALRPQPTYAAPGGGQVGTRNGLAPPLSGCEDVPGVKTYVDDDTKLQAAITSSVDDSIICITGTSGFQLSQTLVLDDTSITLMGDDSSISLLPPAGAGSTSLRHMDVDFDEQGAGDDSLVIRSLTFTGDDTVNLDGASIKVQGIGGDSIRIYDSVFKENLAAGNGGALQLYTNGYIHDSLFIDNSSSAGGGAIVGADELTIHDTRFEGNTAVESGGAIYNVEGDLDVVRSVFVENEAVNGGGIYHQDDDLNVFDSSFVSNVALLDSSGAYGLGGAIDSDRGASVYVLNTAFTDNRAAAKGGAMHLDRDEWVIYGSTFDSNRVLTSDNTELGGAIYATEGDLYVETSYFTNNYAVYGGGIAVLMSDDGNDQRFDVEQSAFVGNDAKTAGAGVYVVAPDGDRVLIADSSFIANGDDTAPIAGGAVIVTPPGGGTPGYRAAIRNTTIVGNQAVYRGAGVFWAVNKDDTPSDNGLFQLTYLTVTDNTLVSVAGGVNFGAGIYVPGGVDAAFVLNSVLWDNTIADDTASDLSGVTTALVNSSVTSVDSIYVVQADDSIIGDPLLGALGDNGGPRIGANGAYYLPTRRPVWNTPVITTVYAGSSLPAPSGAPRDAVDQLGAQRSVPATLGAVVAASRPPTPAPVIPPSAPLNVSGVGGDGVATITWSAPASAGSFPVSTFQAVVSPGGQSCLATSSPCTITGLSNGTEYTVQVRALSGAGWGAFSSPSAPFTPESPPVAKSILITGSRGEVRGRPGVIIDGTSTGMVGEQVAPWVKFPGQSGYTEGSARPTVDAQGDFTWQRRTGKKIYVYFRSVDKDVRSNRVIIAAPTNR